MTALLPAPAPWARLVERPRPPRPTRAATPHPITDCAEWAWWLAGHHCLDALPATLAPGDVPRLHQAGVSILAPHLTLEWALRGYVATLVPAAVFAPTTDTDSLYTEVADAAVAALDPADLLRAAGIGQGCL
jgi:hypothetical protein